jgi:ribosomal protein S11
MGNKTQIDTVFSITLVTVTKAPGAEGSAATTGCIKIRGKPDRTYFSSARF